MIQFLTASVHSLVKYYKSNNQVIQINLPSVQEAPIQLNNQAYNEDIVTLKEFSAFSLILIAGIIFRATRPKSPKLSVLIFIAFCRRFLVTLGFLFITLTFYIRNQSLRKFAWKFSSCKCNEM